MDMFVCIKVYKGINNFWRSLGICYTVVSIQGECWLDVSSFIGIEWVVVSCAGYTACTYYMLWISVGWDGYY
ncbi:hypothetical protein BDQ94DRAFT_149838 [Aspergillus welwitschiae]|uniref:Uncharacterized protein n=1 Tax=Aspergillus welwitschiae TaxID=1341132 RepID=A0A3F3PS63_9EURO|nr:hypothetical protein BDQ94DRAFT_149838 [Aspergillus welwitschiae]RDH29780.1 hypothetical protein BDQ94DRAFT_149838 [Aspergillus welwitschiae]